MIGATVTQDSTETNWPSFMDIYIDVNNTVYTLDIFNRRVQRWDSNDSVGTTVFNGTGGEGAGQFVSSKYRDLSLTVSVHLFPQSSVQNEYGSNWKYLHIG